MPRGETGRKGMLGRGGGTAESASRAGAAICVPSCPETIFAGNPKTAAGSTVGLADDSDAAGAGEFRAGWKPGTTVKPALWSGVSSKSSGGYWTFTSTNANAVITRAGESATPKVFLELSDDDRDAGDPCGTGAWTPTWGKGSNTCADWTTAGASLVLPETSATTPFKLYVAKNSPVMFTVTGRVVTTVS